MKLLVTKTIQLIKPLFIVAAGAAIISNAAVSDVDNYFVRKGHLYSQLSEGAPGEATFLKYAFHAAVRGNVGAITSVDGLAPSGFQLAFDQTGSGYEVLSSLIHWQI